MKLTTDEKLLRLWSKLNSESALSAQRHEQVTKDFESLKADMVVMERRIKDVDQKYSGLCEEVYILKQTVNDLQQAALINDIVIRNVPEVENTADDLLTLTQLILTKTNCVTPISICSVQRIGRKKDPNDNPTGKSASRPILLTLSTKKEKEDIMAAKKKAHINCGEIQLGDESIGPINQVIYFDEHLTKRNSDLHFNARQLRKRKLVKHVWVRNGQVFIRKNIGDKAVRIADEFQIKEYMKRKFNSTPHSYGDDDPMMADIFDQSTINQLPKKPRDGAESINTVGEAEERN